MNSIVVILVPWEGLRSDAKAASRQSVGETECIEIPNVPHSEPVEDADQLPLWRWFTF